MYILTLFNKYHFAQFYPFSYSQVAQILLTSLFIPIKLHKILDKYLTTFKDEKIFIIFFEKCVDKSQNRWYTNQALKHGEMSEWFKVLAWNAGVR